MKMDIYVGYELYSAGPDAEGQDYVAEPFFVVAELEDGARYRKGFFAGAEQRHTGLRRRGDRMKLTAEQIEEVVVEALIEDRESLEQEEMSTPYTHEDYEDRIAELEKDLEQSIEHIDNLQFCSEERGFFYCPNCGEGTKHTKDCYIVFLDKHKP